MKRITQLIIALFVSNSLLAQSIQNWDTVTFETTVEYLKTDTSAGNLWHICVPDKLFFDSAYSPDKAIVTDSTGYYPESNHSFFDLYIGTFNNQCYPYNTFIEIVHKFDTDTLKDGGYITVSYDHGRNWMNIIHDSIYFGEGPMFNSQNLYNENDTLFNGEFGFSGRSDGWIKTEFSWYVLPVKSTRSEIGDTMIIRFNFISDSVQSEKEGWMIDNIRLYSVWIGGAGIDNFNVSDFLKIYPNPTATIVNIKFDKTNYFADIEIFELSGKFICKSHFPTTDNVQIDCSGLKTGVYLLRTTLNSKAVYYNKVTILR